MVAHNVFQQLPVHLPKLPLYLNKQVTVEEVNAAMKAASNESFGYTEDEIVSTDIIGINLRFVVRCYTNQSDDRGR